MGGYFNGVYGKERPEWYDGLVGEVKSGLKVGDIIVYKNRGLPSKMISTFATSGGDTHVGIYMGNGKVGQVVDYYGLGKTKGDSSKRKYGAIESVDFEDTLSSCEGFKVFEHRKAPEDVRDKIPGFVEERFTRKNGYDVVNLLKHFSNKCLPTKFKIKARKDDRKLSCATLITRAFERNGYDVVNIPETQLPMPDDIRENENIGKKYDVDFTSGERPPL